MNIQRYSYIRDEQDGVCFCRIAERGNGEYIKSKDVSELSSLLYAWRDKYLSDLSLNACNELNRLIEQIAPPNLTSELADGTALESSSDLSKAINLLQRCADNGLNITCNNQLSEDVCLFLKHRT
jgi:hypothetical protein